MMFTVGRDEYIKILKEQHRKGDAGLLPFDVCYQAYDGLKEIMTEKEFERWCSTPTSRGVSKI